MNDFRKKLKDKKRIVIKIGSSSLTHENTGELNLFKIEKLIRVICDLKGEGKDVVLVSSGAIAAGRQVLGGQKRPQTISEKQAYAAVGQARSTIVSTSVGGKSLGFHVILASHQRHPTSQPPKRMK